MRKDKDIRFYMRYSFYTIFKTSCEISSIKFKYEKMMFALKE